MDFINVESYEYSLKILVTGLNMLFEHLAKHNNRSELLCTINTGRWQVDMLAKKPTSTSEHNNETEESQKLLFLAHLR